MIHDAQLPSGEESMDAIDVSFPHGLGDCVYFAHALPIYRKRGHSIRVKAPPEKQFLFTAAGIDSCDNPRAKVPWNHGLDISLLDPSNYWRANKAFVNFSVPPLPNVGPQAGELWTEFTNTKLKVALPESVLDMARAYFSSLQRPIILLHTKGNSFQSAKSVPDALAVSIYREILEQTEGTVILLDWDNRVPRIAHGRIRHLTDDWKRISVEELLAAISLADLFVGVDSGPLHLCRFTDTPAVGIWFNQHHPAIYSLPRKEQVNVTPKKGLHRANKMTRWFFNIVEDQSESLSPSIVGRTCAQMLGPTRYCKADEKGRDVMLRHWIDDWTRGGLSFHQTFVDRNVSFDLILRHARRFPQPQIVETGCIRSPEDWTGAGYATYLFCAAAATFGGELVSVDCNEKHCAFAREELRPFGSVGTVVCSDSVEYLRSRSKKIDILYLDSRDTEMPGFAEHALREIQTAERLLHGESMVVYDDTSFRAGKWQGNGSQGVPWLLERGWKPLHIGHQVVLTHPFGDAGSSP